jgi:hypothetical protein
VDDGPPDHAVIMIWRAESFRRAVPTSGYERKKIIVHVRVGRISGLATAVVVGWVTLVACSSAGGDAPVPQVAVAPAGDGVPDQPASDAIPDPCELVTDAEASSLLGVDVGHGVGTEALRGRHCDWTWDEGSTGGKLHVSVWHGQEFWSPSTFGGMPVSGIGDEALQEAGLIQARVGDNVFQVFGYGLESDQIQAVAHAAAAGLAS